MVPPDSDRAPPTPPYSGYSLGSSLFRVRGCHPLRPALPGAFPYMLLFLDGCPTTPRAPRRPRFGLAPFRSPLLGGSLLFSSPPATWMFRFAGFAPASWPVPCLRTAGYPIRAPADHRPLAPPRGISPPAAPFIASGSHRHPPCALSRLPLPAAPRQRLHHGTADARSSCVFSLLDYSLRSLSPRPAHNRPVSRPSATRRDASSFHPVNEPPPCPRREKWRMRGSNPRPPACKAGALAN